MAVQRKQRHVTFRDQNDEASSHENMTPPMGDPKAAARPAAAPAEMISRWSASSCSLICSNRDSAVLLAVSLLDFRSNLVDLSTDFFFPLPLQRQQPDVDSRQPQYVSVDPSEAPIWTMGPSGPSGRPLAHAQIVPKILVTMTW